MNTFVNLVSRSQCQSPLQSAGQVEEVCYKHLPIKIIVLIINVRTIIVPIHLFYYGIQFLEKNIEDQNSFYGAILMLGATHPSGYGKGSCRTKVVGRLGGRAVQSVGFPPWRREINHILAISFIFAQTTFSAYYGDRLTRTKEILVIE